MTAAYSKSNGANFANVAEIAVPMPATFVDGELALMWALISNRTGEVFGWPDGWAELLAATDQGSDFCAAAAWRRMLPADGGTSPVVTFGSGGASGSCRVHCFTGVQRWGTPFEGLAVAKGTSVTMSTSAVTTRGRDRLAVVLSGLDVTTARSTGYTGYTQRVTGSGNNTRRYVDDQVVATPQTVAAQSCLSPADDWITLSLALLPAKARARRILCGA